MATLRIPPEHIVSLTALANADSKAAAELASVLEAASPQLRSSAFKKLVRQRVTALPGSETEGIVDALLEMGLVRAGAGVDLDEFVGDVEEALREDSDLTTEQGLAIRDRLKVMLALPSIALPAKGRSLLIEHAHYMCDARVFTDVRPIFGVDVEQTPETALIVHTLKLTYHMGQADTKDFFIVLDSHDLDELSELIDRARAKEKSLKVLLASAGLDPLE